MDFKVRYISKKIKEIKNPNERILLTGKIVESTGKSFILSDDTGRVEIFAEDKVPKDMTVRAYCSVDGETLKLDFLQDISVSDLNLFKKVEDLYRKVGI